MTLSREPTGSWASETLHTGYGPRMGQQFVVYAFATQALAQQAIAELTRHDFQAGQGHTGGAKSVQIRVRNDSDDRTEAARLVASVDRQAKPTLEATPSMSLRGYREGV